MTDEPTAEEMVRTLRSEAAKVRRWLRKTGQHFEARQYAGYDMPCIKDLIKNMEDDEE